MLAIFETIKNHVQFGRDFVLDLIFPTECLSCGAEDSWLCYECLKKIKLNDQQHCPVCKIENEFGAVCVDCQENYFLDGVLIAGHYDDQVLQAAIKTFKYNFVLAVGERLAEFLAIFLKNIFSKNIFINSGSGNNFIKTFKNAILMPVPLHRSRQRWRGFNQANILAQNLAQYFDLSVNSDSLLRIKKTKSQAKLDASGRHENVKGSFSWKANNLLGQNIIIIDDVATTNSTLNECARVLKAAGAGQVWGLVVAKN